MKVVGLSGYARSGKDEAAKVLVEEFGFERISFADKLRDFLYALNPLVEFEPNYVPTGFPARRVQDIIDLYGWDGYKNTPYVAEIRPLLQRLGTEAGRDVLWDSIWIDAAFVDMKPDGKYVIADARFPNEAFAVTDRGGLMWRINRLGNKPATLPDGTVHSSETSLDKWDFDHWITNEGTLEEFHDTIRFLAKEELT